MQSFKAVAPIEKAGDTVESLIILCLVNKCQMVCTVSAFDLMLCCGVALWAMLSITPCANIELPVLQSILDYKE